MTSRNTQVGKSSNNLLKVQTCRFYTIYMYAACIDNTVAQSPTDDYCG